MKTTFFTECGELHVSILLRILQQLLHGDSLRQRQPHALQHHLHLLANLLPQVLQQQLIRAERERILQQFQSGKLPAESLGQAAQLFNEVGPCLEILTVTLKASKAFL